MSDYYEQMVSASERRLREALDKPLPPDTDAAGIDEYFDPWEDLFDGVVGAYNSDLDQLAIDVLRAVRDQKTFDILDDEQRGLAAELFLHMLCVWLCEYGTSPRGAFPASTAIGEMLPELIAKWEGWFAISWGEEPQSWP